MINTAPEIESVRRNSTTASPTNSGLPVVNSISAEDTTPTGSTVDTRSSGATPFSSLVTATCNRIAPSAGASTIV